MFSYRSILKQALNLSWKNKYLWFFGLFASLTIAGGTIESQFITQSFGEGVTGSSFAGLESILNAAGIFGAIFIGIPALFSQNIIVILNSITIIILIVALAAAIIWLAISSQAAIVKATKKLLNSKKKIQSLEFRESLSEGSKKFWPVLLLNILIRFLITIAFFISSLPLLLMIISDSYFFVILYTILFVIFVPVALSLSLIVKYAISYCILEDEPFIKALEKGYDLFKKNWLISLEVGVLLFLITLLSSFVLLVLLTIFVFPLFAAGAIFSYFWLIALTVLIAFIVVITFGSLLTTFQISSWTNLYLHLKANKGRAKLERLFFRNK